MLFAEAEIKKLWTHLTVVFNNFVYLVPLEIGIELRIVVKESFREMLELLGHGDSVREEVLLKALHQGAEADVGVALVVHRHQQRRQQVGHSLKRKVFLIQERAAEHGG